MYADVHKKRRKSACNGHEEEGQLDLAHIDRRHCTYASASYYFDLKIQKNE